MTGTTISHYTIGEKLGEGGMGIVYKAHDTSLDRNVALKFLPHYLTSDATEKERFYHEARAASALNHPNITTIFEIAEHDGRLYIAMELVEGQTLKQMIASAQPSLKKVLDIAIQICDGLSAAEEKHIVHRDLKADNIMITPKGQVKIMDFGLAKVKGSTKLTKAGSTLGTAAYMSPEQAQGEEVDHRSDIFSFGVVLYELLTTKLPFRGEHQAALMYSLINEDPQPLARYNETVSPDLDRIVMKSLAKDRDERYQHIDDLLADLRRERKGLEYARAGYVTGRTTSLFHTAPPPRKSLRSRLIIAGILVALAGAFLVFNPFNVQVSTQKAAASGKDALAILYFQNIVDPADKGHVGDMLADLLITSLSQSQGVEVISRERLFDIQKELNTDSKSITPEMATRVAQRAGVSKMLLGSIIQEEPQLAVTTRLVDVATGRIISSKRVSGYSQKQIFSLVDSISSLVRADLALGPESAVEIKSVADVTTKSPEAYRSFSEAVAMEQKFFYSDAIPAYRKAIELDSNFASAYIGLGSASGYVSDAERQAAIRHAWRLRESVTELERMTIEMTYAKVIESDYPKSLEILRTLVVKYPRKMQHYLTLAGGYFDLGQFDKAKSIVAQGVKYDTLNKTLWNQYGYMLAAEGKKEEAMRAMDRYVALAPAEPNPYDSRGDIFMVCGEPDTACAWWLKALSFRPDFSSTQKLEPYYLLKRDFDAVRKYTLVSAANAGFFQESYVQFNEQMINVAVGKLRDAYDNLHRYTKTLTDPKYEDGVITRDAVLTMLAYELGDVKGMKECALHRSEMLRKSPLNKLYGRDLLAVALAAGGETDKADAMLKDIRPIAEGEPRVIFRSKYHYAVAMVDYIKGNYAEAVKEFEQSLAPTIPNHYPDFFYAISLMKSNQREAAVSEFRKLTLRAPIGNSSYDLDYLPASFFWPVPAIKAHYWLGVACEQKGEKDQAIKEYATFADYWKEADFNCKELTDAKMRMGKLKSGTNQ